MDTEQVSRGMHLRMCRQNKKMTLQDLSDRTGLSVGFLSKIENGVGNPSVSNIQKICYALGITANELIASASSDEPVRAGDGHTSYVLRKHERRPLYYFSDVVRFEALFEGNPHFKVNVMTLTGGAHEHFGSTHSYDEFGIVAKGVMLIMLEDGTKYELSEGDCIMIRAQTHHTTVPVSPEECVSYWVEISESPLG